MSDTTRASYTPASALPAGTRLGEFEILAVLGVGGFGIVYLAFDHQLEREVAVKEYMPTTLVGRTETLHVSLRSRSDTETFELGLRSFVNEAKMLAKFDHPSLIKVHRFWESNGTAYMAMPVLRGRTLKQVRQEMSGVPDEAWLRAMLSPLLEALEMLHSQGVYHRDISPDNVHVEADGHPVLVDFGAARRVIVDKSQSLTAILKPAYAPIEQYAEAGSVKQGAWTDLYSLGATVHFLLLGHPPAPATTRAVHDEQAPLAQRGVPGISHEFLQSVDWMLAPRPMDRPQSVRQLRDRLAGSEIHDLERGPVHAAADERPAARRGFAELRPNDEDTVVKPPGRPPASAPATIAPDTPSVPNTGSPSRLVSMSAVQVGTQARPAAPEEAVGISVANRELVDVAPQPRTSKSVTMVLSALVVVAIAGGGWYALKGTGEGDSALPSQALAASGPVVVPPPNPASAPPGLGNAGAAGHGGTDVVGVTAGPSEPTVKSTDPQVGPPGGKKSTTTKHVKGPAPPASNGQKTEDTESAKLPPPDANSAAPAPVTPPLAEPVGPEARCAGLSVGSHIVCMERECRSAEHRSHADCKKWWHENAGMPSPYRN